MPKSFLRLNLYGIKKNTANICLKTLNLLYFNTNWVF